MENRHDNIEPSISAEDRIREILQNVGVLGANDFELSEIEKLLNKVRSGCSPEEAEEAVRRATQIKDRKAAYH